jgi:hypothetical protein
MAAALSSSRASGSEALNGPSSAIHRRLATRPTTDTATYAAAKSSAIRIAKMTIRLAKMLSTKLGFLAAGILCG